MRWKVLSALAVVVGVSCAGENFVGGDADAGGAAGVGTDGGENGTGTGGNTGGSAGSVGGTSRGGSATAGDTSGAGTESSGGEESGGTNSGGGTAGSSGGKAGSGSGGKAGSAGGGAAGSGGSGGMRPVFTELLADGFVRTAAHAVSGDGTYVAGQATLMGGYMRAIRWTNADAMELGTALGWIGAYGTGISDDGSVVVGTINTAASTFGIRWEGSIVELPPLVRGNDYAEVFGVSGDGNVIIGLSTTTNGEVVPIQWIDSGVQQLPLLTGHRTATPRSVDYDGGLIVGTGVIQATDANEAVRWPASGVFALGIDNSEVYAVSSDSRYATGGYVETPMLGALHRVAFRWSAGGVDYLVPTMMGELDCVGHAISGNGSIVAARCTEYVSSTVVTHWLLWSEATGMVSLDQVLLELGVDTSLYDYWEITDISSDGTAVIGNTRRGRDGVGMGFRAYIDSVFP